MKFPCTAVLAASTAVLLGTAALPTCASAQSTTRQQDVAQRGAAVMPFSLAATRHIFTKTADGGIQQVVTNRDRQQVPLIRHHLSMIASQFSAGDFEAPAQIHGEDMPGLAALRSAKPGELTIHYRDLPDGGEIVFRASEPRLVAALHEWFDAQLSDHGHDAMAGHAPGMMHHHSMDGSMAN